MKLVHLVEGLEEMEELERTPLLYGLFNKLTPVSMATIEMFQQEFFNNLDYDKESMDESFIRFVKEQNAVIKTCIALECSILGAGVREQYDLPPLTMGEEIEPTEPDKEGDGDEPEVL